MFILLFSVFMWNNETINIWSHLAGCFIFFILILHDNLVRIPLYKGSISDHVVVTAALMCFMVSKGTYRWVSARKA